MSAFQRIPPELFYQIALHLPLTKDVLAFRLTNALIRDALSTPALFKARLALRGWDLSASDDKGDAAQSPGDFERWTRIDHSFCRTAQLFDEATAEGYFLTTTTSDSPAHPDPGSGQDDRSPDPGQVPDEKMPVTWLRKLSWVLPLFVAHHRTHVQLLLSAFSETYHLFNLSRWRKHLVAHYRSKTSRCAPCLRDSRRSLLHWRYLRPTS